MGYRLSKIYTRTGDDGTTGMADGSRISKDDIRVEAIGSVDELNSVIGLISADLSDREAAKLLTTIQNRLFDLGAELALGQHESRLQDDDILQLEKSLEHYNEELPPLKEFILPGGSRVAALCHCARAVSRRAERAVVALSKSQSVSTTALAYLNRLSDLLFVLARWLNRASGQQDVLWQPVKKE